MKKNSGCKGVWFIHRENPTPGQNFAKPHVLLPVLDVTKVKPGVLNSISKTPRLRIPRHMEYIMDLSDANTRFIQHVSFPDDRQVIALDHEAVNMLRQAGAVVLRPPYRHELMSSTKAS